MEVLQLERALYAIRTEIHKYWIQNGNNPDYICLSESLFGVLCDSTVNVVQVEAIWADGIPYTGNTTIYGINLRTDPTLTGFKFIIGKEIDCGSYFFGGVTSEEQ